MLTRLCVRLSSGSSRPTAARCQHSTTLCRNFSTKINGKSHDIPTQLFIDNEFVDGSSTLSTYNPADGDHVTDIQAATTQDINSAVRAASRVFNSWSQSEPAFRQELLHNLAGLVRREASTLAAIETLDSGKPYTSSLEEDVPDVLRTLRYYAGWADKLNGTSYNLGSSMAYTIREPIGVCGLITAFNYPLCNAVWKLAPALAAGNTVVLKPSEYTSLSSLYLAKLIKEAGFPAGVVNIVPGKGSEAGAALASHPGVGKIAFTGSTTTGAEVMRLASTTLKTLTLETGGKSPFIVFEDADVEQAARWAYQGAFPNSGQICTSTARMLVHEKVYVAFIEELRRYTIQEVTVGNPFDSKTTMGPVVSSQAYDRVRTMIEAGRNEPGVQFALGSAAVPAKGYYIPPIIFTHVGDTSPLANTEIFGPVAVVCTSFTNEREAIHRANATKYGLGAAVFTKDVGRANRVAKEIKSGMVWINSTQDCDPRVPFGGVKMSGVGRELGEEGINAYTISKSVYVNCGSERL
jgi:aldehyde dehydrogenase (NAD+)